MLRIAHLGDLVPRRDRIVCMGPAGDRIMVVDIAAGSASGVAEGRAAIWLDQLTLLVEDL